MHYISWQEIEEWKATQETLSDHDLMTNLKAGRKAEEKSDLTGVKL